MNPRLYLKTTIPSYLVARRSRDLRLAAAHVNADEIMRSAALRQPREFFDSSPSPLFVRGGGRIYFTEQFPRV